MNNKNTLRKEEGGALITFLVFLSVLSVLGLGSIRVATLNYMSAESETSGKKAFYSSEVALDLAVKDIIDSFDDLTVYTTSADDGAADGEGFIHSTYDAYAVKYKITNPVTRYLYQNVIGNSTMFHFAYTYDIEAASLSSGDKSGETLLEKIRILETPLIQYFLFWGASGDAADLELYPAADFNAWGRIHANRDVYVGSFGDLNIRNFDTAGNFTPHFVTAGGELFQLRKDSLTNIWGANNVHIKAGNSTVANMVPEEDIVADITAANEVAEEARFNDYVLINEQTYATPPPQQLQRGNFYEDNADAPGRPGVDGMKIVGQGPLGGGTSVFVSRPALTDVTNMINTATLPDASASTVTLPMVTETVNAFCDDRESRIVNTTNIDLFKLETWYQEYLANLGLTPGSDGILVYASRSPNAAFTNLAGNMESIRLMQLAPGSSPQVLDETTVATDNPMYIHGDFNTVNRRGVVLISDAHNILSNAFTTKACNQNVTTMAAATATTVNAGLVGGNVPQAVSSGLRAGGAHNYPRMHENWSSGIPDVPLNILGSFINLGPSQVATGTWTYDADRYRAPIRNWGWDINFQNPNFWPPYIPSIYSVERVGYLE